MSCVAHQLAAERGLLHTADVDVIRRAVASLPADRDIYVADLGAGSGTTALAVFGERHHGAHVFTVDNDQVALDSAQEAIINSGFAYPAEEDLGHWQYAHALSWDGAAVWRAVHPHRVLDMLLIDADHSLEGIDRDLAAWIPLVRPGGLVWFHDFRPTDGGWWPAVAVAVEREVAAGRLDFIETAGWCWLGRKAGGAR